MQDYHLLELQIALSPSDPRHEMPEIPQSCARVLDVGCGAGQTLIACKLPNSCELYGVDTDLQAIALGKRLSQNISFLVASGERLPFPKAHFDFVFSRVALPYMHIPKALREFHRVLKPGGQVWLLLHPFTIVKDQILHDFKTLRVKDLAYRCFVVVNGIALHACGVQFRYPMKRDRCGSFQTTAGMRRALEQAGFADLQMRREPQLVATAVKPARAGDPPLA